MRKYNISYHYISLSSENSYLELLKCFIDITALGGGAPKLKNLGAQCNFLLLCVVV